MAECCSLVTKVESRRKNFLYIDDGVYGSLHDAGFHDLIYPVNVISDRKNSSKNLSEFSFFGPTCCSYDFINGPYLLPNDITAGDFIVFNNMGAYSINMATNFNGFSQKREVLLKEDIINWDNDSSCLTEFFRTCDSFNKDEEIDYY